MTVQPFRAIYPNFQLIASPDAFFDSVKEEFPAYWRNGFFLQDSEEAIFIYDIEAGPKSFSGVVACIDIRDYLEGRVKQHETTLAAKEQKMMNLHLQRRAMIKPTLVAHRHEAHLAEIAQSARNAERFIDVRFEAGERHSLYKVRDRDQIEMIQSVFRNEIETGYIADGHHRFATSAKLYGTVRPGGHTLDFSSILAVLMPQEEVIIHDYNRVVEILHEITPTQLIARIAALCEIEPLGHPAKPERKFELTMYINQEWYKLHWRPEVIREFEHRTVIFDGEILNQKILGDILQIEDVRFDTRLKYVEGIAGIEGVVEKAEKNAYRIAFCLYPVRMEEIITVADNGKTLPPKSTWFEPRVKNGILAKSF